MLLVALIAWTTWSLLAESSVLPAFNTTAVSPTHLGGATVYGTLLFSSLLQLGAEAGTFKGSFLALETVAALINFSSFLLQCRICPLPPMMQSSVCAAQVRAPCPRPRQVQKHATATP